MKNIQIEQRKLFEKFLSDELTDLEKATFKENYDAFPSFRKKYEEYLNINHLLSTLDMSNYKLDQLDELTISEFERYNFKKKFHKVNKIGNSSMLKRYSVFWKIAAAVFIVTGLFQISRIEFNQLFQKETRPVVSAISGRCYSNGILLRKGDLIENNLIQSGKKSSCLISFSKNKDSYTIQLFPETELVNAQSEKSHIWKLNIGKIYTITNLLNVQILVKDHLISMEKSSALVEFEKGNLNLEALNGKIQISQNSAFLFGANSRRVTTKIDAKIFSEKFPQYFGEIKNEIEEGTGYLVKFNPTEINQKESILLEIEALINPERKEISELALSEIDSFLKISGPKIQKSLSYLATPDFPSLKEKRQEVIQNELVALISPEPNKKNSIQETHANDVNEFKKEEEEYYRLAQESFEKKPALIFSLSLKDSTSIIGELSGKEGFYIIKTLEGKNLEIKRDEVAFIELR